MNPGVGWCDLGVHLHFSPSIQLVKYKKYFKIQFREFEVDICNKIQLASHYTTQQYYVLSLANFM